MRADYPADVHVVPAGGREFIVVGTAHISRESADLVREVITQERPDCVCVELDAGRFEALSQQHRFESLDLREVIRRRQLSTLMLNLVLAAYQRQLGVQLGVMPGTELLEATEVARELGIPVELCDRDVRITLRRAWRGLSTWKRLMLLSGLLGAVFERQELSEEDLRELRQQDVLSKLMAELGEAFPSLKSVLIDERDRYLAHKIRAASGERVVAVVGAGHVHGIREALREEAPADLAALEEIPASSSVGKWIGWGIPIAILGALGVIGVRQGAGAVGESVMFWALATGLPSMVGAILAWGHPVTIASALVAAPITTLHPLIGVGYVTAFFQAYFRPPLVREIREVSQDVLRPPRWWTNRLLRIFLVFVFTTIGGLLGVWIGGAELLSKLV